ncbi:MAG TPA: GNAT family N-acetyltransferase [Candidatus Limnocylindria bacterium]|nr:GNAT family N-acetyltransferase [Candidatus Limnocylindria bacterium]
MTALAAGVRAFTPADYEGWVAGTNRCYPDYPFTLAEVRHQDECFDTSRYFFLRLVAEEGGSVVGGVQVNHRPGRFHPDRYSFDIWVLPDARRRGWGTRLYDAALGALRERGAVAATAGAKESMTDGVEFLRHRGWVEVKRDWESRLPVAAFDPAPFASASERVASQGIRIATYAEELARDADAERRLYELVDQVRGDVPAIDPATPETIDEWRPRWTGAPGFIPEACFIAIDGDGTWLGVSNLERPLEDPTFLWQGLTGVRREFRGRGVAMALKLRTAAFARASGVDHIKTWNDQRNRPMLSINEAMGFVKQPAWLALELRLRS